MLPGDLWRSQYMYGLPARRGSSSSIASSLSEAHNLHYQSFIAFQQHAMVMSQMLQKMTAPRRRSQSPDAILQPLPVPVPPYFSFSPTEDHRLQLPSTFPELDDCSSPLFLRAPSDHGYCSSLTSDSRSKSSRLSTGSETSEKSRSFRLTPDTLRTKSSRAPSALDDNSKSSDGFSGSIQTPEVSSSVVEPGLSPVFLDEDSRKSVSKFLPSFCSETSNQSVMDCDIEIKIEPEDPVSPSSTLPSDQQPSSSATTSSCSPGIEIEFARNVKEEVDSPVKFLNSDVMWSVKPDAIAKSQLAFVPSPDESSNDLSAELNTYQTSYFGHLGRGPAQGSMPPIMPFTPLEPKRIVKSKPMEHGKKDLANSSTTQTEAMDLSVPKKRKGRIPMKENVKKRQRKDSKMKQSKQDKQEPNITQTNVSEKQIWKRDPAHILQVSERQNIQPVVYVQEPSEEAVVGAVEVEQTKPKHTKVKQEKEKEKKYQCSKCDKCYSQRSSLHTHMRIHTGVRPYACKDCGRTFTDCSTYIKHCRLHTGEKPYACGVCGRCFTQSGNMMRHQLKCKLRT